MLSLIPCPTGPWGQGTWLWMGEVRGGLDEGGCSGCSHALCEVAQGWGWDDYVRPWLVSKSPSLTG